MSSEPQYPATVVLHRLSFAHRKVAFLEGHHVKVIRGSSVASTCRALSEAKGIRFVVVDIGTGSDAPEQIRAWIKALDSKNGEPAPEMLGCAKGRHSAVTSRMARLGLKQAYVWPEGLFSELMEHLGTMPFFSVKSRPAPRALLQKRLEQSDGGLDGRLLNISASGALLELGQEPEIGHRLQVELTLPPNDTPTTMLARVQWSEPVESRFQVGVQFLGMSKATRAAVTEYVRRLNLIQREDRPVRDPNAETALVKARLQGTNRADYFQLRGDPKLHAMLIPKKPFFVPYRAGDELLLKFVRAAKTPELLVRITGRVLLDPTRVDGLIGWRVKIARRATRIEEILHGEDG